MLRRLWRGGLGRLLACALLLVGIPATVAQDDNPLAGAVRGTVTGRVTMGTAASLLPPDLRVNLLLSDPEAILEQYETGIDPAGSFTFTDIPLVTGIDYAAVVVYRDRAFRTPYVQIAAGAATLDLPITIYDPTEDPAVLSITETVIQVSAAGETMEVRQVIRFQNSSDRIFTSARDFGGGRFASVVVTLPPGAQIVSFDDPQRYVTVDEQFTVIDTAPVYPGSDHTVVVVYILPYDGSPALIEQPYNYLFQGNARLLIWPDSLNGTSEQLPTTGEETLGERTYRTFSGTVQLLPGDVLRYELSGAPAVAPTAETAVGGGGLSPLVIIIGIGLGLVILIVLMRGRGGAPEDDEAERLFQQIQALDQQHAAGQLNHDLWHRQRAPLKARLDALLVESDEDE